MDLCAQTSDFTASKKIYDGAYIVDETFPSPYCDYYATSALSTPISPDFVYRAFEQNRNLDPFLPTFDSIDKGLSDAMANYSVKATYDSNCTEPIVVRFDLTEECDSNFNGSFSDRNCSKDLSFSMIEDEVLIKTDCLQSKKLLAAYNQISSNTDVSQTE